MQSGSMWILNLNSFCHVVFPNVTSFTLSPAVNVRVHFPTSACTGDDHFVKMSTNQMSEKISALQTGLPDAQGFFEDARGPLQGSDGGGADGTLGTTDPNCGQSGQQVSGRGRHPGPSLLRNDKMAQLLWKTIWQLLKRLHTELPSDPAIPLLIYT